MLRRFALAATIVGGTVGGSLIAFSPSTVADGSGACLTVNVSVNGQGSGGPQTVCTPAAPGLPALPGIP